MCEREREREKMCVLGEYFVTDAFIRSIFLSTFKVKLTKGIGRYCVKSSPAGFYLRRSYLGQERCVKKRKEKKRCICITKWSVFHRLVRILDGRIVGKIAALKACIYGENNIPKWSVFSPPGLCFRWSHRGQELRRRHVPQWQQHHQLLRAGQKSL